MVLTGYRLIHGPYGIYQQDSSTNYFERITTRDNYESGFQIRGVSAYNIVFYLDSYGNHDPRKNGKMRIGLVVKREPALATFLKEQDCGITWMMFLLWITCSPALARCTHTLDSSCSLYLLLSSDAPIPVIRAFYRSSVLCPYCR